METSNSYPSTSHSQLTHLWEDNLEDAVSNELMTKAVTVWPCGHVFNEDTVIKCLAHDRLCPLDRKEITNHVINYQMRNLADIALELQKPPQENSSPFDAQAYFLQGKAYFEKREHEKALQSFESSLQLDPSHEKAQNYRDTCLKALEKEKVQMLQPSVPQDENILLATKLSQPGKSLSAEDSVRLLLDCIAYGNQQVQKAQDKNLVIVLGNTGAGKSTAINFLYGCTMGSKSPDELGTTGLEDLIVVKPQADGGAFDEIMPIGHTKESKTFIPQIETDPQFKNTYCDCPGFLDNRGVEINIANAVNIKNALKAAKSVKVIILINYYSLRADRARGLTEMFSITSDLFGNAQNLIEHKDAILFGITNTPPRLSLTRIVDWLCDSKFPLLKELAHCFFTFDPLDQPPEGGWNRATFLEQIDQLTPILEPSKIFRTVLTYEDENKLIEISEEIGRRIREALKEKNYHRAAIEFEHLNQLTIIDHASIVRLISSCENQIERQFQSFLNTFKDHCNFERFTQAQELLNELKKALSYFEKPLIDLSSLEQYYHDSYEKYELAIQKEKEYQEQIQKANKQIEEFIALLEEQKQHTEKQLEAQKRNFEAMIHEMEEAIKAATLSHESFKVQMMQEMEERLVKKEQELQQIKGKTFEETQKLLQKEKERLKQDYEKKLEEKEKEKEAFIQEQKTQRTQREKTLAVEQQKLQQKLQEIETKKTEQKQFQSRSSSVSSASRLYSYSPSVPSTSKSKPPAVPDMAFGKAKWEQCIGKINSDEPPLPSYIEQLMNSPCPFWKGKQIKDTHILTLVPELVNSSTLTLERLASFVQHPKAGHKTALLGGCGKIKEEYWKSEKIWHRTSSHWVLMTRDVIPNSRNQSYEAQKKFIASYQGYELPHFLDAAVSILMHYVRTGERLYSSSDTTKTRCQEHERIMSDNNPYLWPLDVGEFAPCGLRVSGFYDGEQSRFGAAGVRKLDFSSYIEEQKMPREQTTRLASSASSSYSTAITPSTSASRLSAPPPSVPDTAFGKAKWEKFFGNVGSEPSLPQDINQILNSNCDIWPEKKIKDTHLLILIPQTVNSNPLTLNFMLSLSKSPQTGHKIEERNICDPSVETSLGNIPAPASHWVLMTKDIIPNSRGGNSNRHKELMEFYAFKGYQIPKLLDAAVAILVDHASTGKWLYPNYYHAGRSDGDRSLTFTRCQETFHNPKNIGKGNVSDLEGVGIGGCSGGVQIRAKLFYAMSGRSLSDSGDGYMGIAGLRKL